MAHQVNSKLRGGWASIGKDLIDKEATERALNRINFSYRTAPLRSCGARGRHVRLQLSSKNSASRACRTTIYFASSRQNLTKETCPIKVHAHLITVIPFVLYRLVMVRRVPDLIGLLVGFALASHVLADLGRSAQTYQVSSKSESTTSHSWSFLTPAVAGSTAGSLH